ncbi:MAG TPA: hypothetical protein ENG14_04340 [Thermodesulforhabdus norvegica]|uniref:Ribbon-helix-helix protein, copG family n=1 Tax=Thermodesulforhabdus norvegica TaxID=39841 RepID=A0A7C0WUP8_9BACT|nr:hypothetical protein [Thermodesulforhabdus norvegica]
MARSSSWERAQRINAALALIKEYESVTKAAVALAARYGISKRQAYRYIHEAEVLGKQVPIPEAKIAFTVKLSQRLIQELRQQAKYTGQTLSEIVTQALEAFLHKDRQGG